MSREADPQQDSVYEWEGEWAAWNASIMSFDNCRRMIDTACAHYGVRPPRVRMHKGKAWSYCLVSRALISLKQADNLNPAIALHEAAHWIVWHLFGDRVQDHGPTFMGVYLWLLEAASVAPVEALHATARKHGLKWRHLPPTAVGKAVARLRDGLRAPRKPAHPRGPTLGTQAPRPRTAPR